MTTNSMPLGYRMKAYEAATRAVLPRRTYTIIRVDIRAAHTLLRRAERPYDAVFMRVMDKVTADLCQEVTGTVFAYTQSDEISLLVTDFAELSTQAWFDGVVQKMASVAAAAATAAFAEHAMTAELAQGFPLTGRCMFDGRVFTIPTDVEVANYFLWRQRDWVRNSVSMAVQAHFPPSRLLNLDREQRKELLLREAEINWDDYSAAIRLGRVTTRAIRHLGVSVRDGVATDVNRHVWVRKPAPRFTAEPDGWLAGMIPPLPSLHTGEMTAAEVEEVVSRHVKHTKEETEKE